MKPAKKTREKAESSRRTVRQSSMQPESSKRGKDGRMSTVSVDTDVQPSNISTSSLRKRHSPNSVGLSSRREVDSSVGSSGSAVQTAGNPKQRKIGLTQHCGKVSSEEGGDTSGGRELRYLTDFFPDQVDGGRLTRSKARGAPTPPAASEPSSPRTVSSSHSHQGEDHTAQSSESHIRTKSKTKRGTVRSSCAKNQQNPSATANTHAMSPPRTTAPVASQPFLGAHVTGTSTFGLSGDPRMYAASGGMWGLALDEGDPGGSNSTSGEASTTFTLTPHVVMPTHYAHAHYPGGTNQIPVIQQSTSSSSNNPPSDQAEVQLGFGGMLFDPISNTAGSSGSNTQQQQHVRTISRSAASQFIHGLVPRMQHLLGGHKGIPQDSRVSGIMEGLRSSNELRQAEAAGELAEWLLMANEDNLPSHLPIRDITQALIQLLQKEHNFELMLTATRCLRNLLEAVPRAQPIVVDAVPYLLEKLKRIECVDVAEQALTALEELSKRNSKTILASGGIAACISHVDFFSLVSQRLAFSIASNCAMYLSSNDFPLVRDSLSDLTERLLVEDKRCLESVCQLFSRLVENLRNHPDKLREIAGTNYRLLSLIQQHLVAQPSQLSSTTFSSVIRMLRTLASKCPDLAAALIRLDYHTTLHSLFTGSYDPEVHEIMERPPNQLQDMVYLVGELFPRLPTSGIFEIDATFSKTSLVNSADGHWYYQDDDMQFQPFRAQENRILEMAKASGQNHHEMAIGGYVYRIDMGKMTQRNLSTGTERQLQRRANGGNKAGHSDEDGRLAMLQSEGDMVERVVATLFPVLVAIDGSSSGPALRFECLRVMLRMVCPVSSAVLRSVLSDLPLSGHIASALASPRSKDLSIVVAALQLVHLLLEKLSDVYAPLFRKEGVAHELQKLAATRLECKSAPASCAASPALQGELSARVTRSYRNRVAPGEDSRVTRGKKEKEKSEAAKDAATPASRHRKRASPDGSSPATKKEKESRRKSSGILNALRIPGIGTLRQSSSASSSPSAAGTPPPSAGGNNGNMGNFIAQIVAQSSSGSSSASLTSSSSVSRSGRGLGLPGGLGINSALSNNTKEKLRSWIKKEAELLLKTYLSDVGGAGGSVIDCLSWVAEQLRIEGEDVGSNVLTQLHDILNKDSVSAFEMTHSGVISALHNYLVSEDSSIQPPRKLRLKRFAAVFMHLTADNLRPSGDDGCFSVFNALVAKTIASAAQLEQFQVKVNDMGGIATGSSGCLRGAQALRFFQSHQIKCCLRRHPNCRELKDYHRNGGSTIKVDPFTSISAIERYLVDKGIGRIRTNGEESSGDEISDDDDTLIGSAHSGEEGRIEILLAEHPLPSQMSVLQALRQYSPQLQNNEDSVSMGNNLWMNTHTLYYRLSAEPAAVPITASSSAAASTGSSQVKEKKHRINEKLWNEGTVECSESPLWSFLEPSLPRNVDDPCVPSLLLLRALHGLNRYWYGLFDEEPVLPTSYMAILPAKTFHCSKLAAKLQRQLSDFISVATQQIPAWASDLVNAVPFLFPFSLRRSLLYCTAFGRDRALMHLVSQTEGVQGEGEAGRLTPRLERRKIVVRRDDLLKTSETALAANATSRAMLEVSFEGEAGTGFGPTLEFYSTVSRELQNVVHKMWNGACQKQEMEDGSGTVEYMVAGHGLYPIAYPHSQRRDAARTRKFEMLGRLMGQALVDCRMLDLPLSPVFLHWLIADPVHLGVPQLEMLDPDMYNSLRSLTQTPEEDFEHLEQYFTMPGNELFELMKGGKNVIVSKDNVEQFIKLVSWWRLAEGVWREMEAVKKGFAQVVDPSHLGLFLPEELDQLFCGCSDGGEKVWGEQAIAQAIKPDHGYTHDSEQIRWLVQMMSSYSHEDQRRFVQFVTGSPRLPVGGFRALNPPLTVVRKTAAYGSGDEELPSAMTCYNYLKIPAYSSYEVFCERFSVALQFIYSFHLT